MFKFIYSILFITVLRIRVAFPQAINWPPLNIIRPQETILEAPRSFTPVYNQILDVPNNPINFPPVSAVSPISPNTATTIITDCSPSVCKNLVNTIQLMIVCSLLQNGQSSSDLAAQLAAPIINEVFPPNLSSDYTNNLFPNPVLPTSLPIPPNFTPSPTVISPNILSNLINPNIISNMPAINTNGLYYNY